MNFTLILMMKNTTHQQIQIDMKIMKTDKCIEMIE